MKAIECTFTAFFILIFMDICCLSGVYAEDANLSFHGIVVGGDTQLYPQLEMYKESFGLSPDSVKMYINKDDELLIGEIPVDSIYYHSYKDKIIGVSVYFQSEYFSKICEYYKSEFGEFNFDVITEDSNSISQKRPPIKNSQVRIYTKDINNISIGIACCHENAIEKVGEITYIDRTLYSLLLKSLERAKEDNVTNVQ